MKNIFNFFSYLYINNFLIFFIIPYYIHIHKKTIFRHIEQRFQFKSINNRFALFMFLNAFVFSFLSSTYIRVCVYIYTLVAVNYKRCSTAFKLKDTVASSGYSELYLMHDRADDRHFGAAIKKEQVLHLPFCCCVIIVFR